MVTPRRRPPLSPRSVVIYENDRGQSWYVCGQARYVREPQLRDPSPLCARRHRDDGPPGGDDARQRGGERPPDGDAHPPDASVTVPFTILLPESERKSIGDRRMTVKSLCPCFGWLELTECNRNIGTWSSQ